MDVWLIGERRPEMASCIGHPVPARAELVVDVSASRWKGVVLVRRNDAGKVGIEVEVRSTPSCDVAPNNGVHELLIRRQPVWLRQLQCQAHSQSTHESGHCP